MESEIGMQLKHLCPLRKSRKNWEMLSADYKQFYNET
jgi:hypothetical protein